MHGGRSTGPKTKEGRQAASSNLLKHGIYSKFFTEEEQEYAEKQADPASIMSLTQEILAAQIELQRVERLIGERRDGNARAGIELVEIHTGGEGRGTTQKFSLPDLRALKDRFLGRIASLKRMQKEILMDAPELNGTIQTRDYRDEVLSRLARRSKAESAEGSS